MNTSRKNHKDETQYSGFLLTFEPRRTEKIADQYFQKTMFDSEHDEESEHLYLF